MNGDLPHIAARIFNTPLMIQGHKLETILAALAPRIFAGELVAPPQPERAVSMGAGAAKRFQGGGYMAGEGIAVLPVIGTLVRRGSWLDAASGITSYAGLQDAATEILMDGGVRGLMLEIDSYGGEAGGCFDLVSFLRTTAAAVGKPIWAHANEAACSGGFAIACSGSRIWLPQMGEVGSIGVVTAHVDMSKADEKAGLKWTYIHAGDHKVDGNPHAPLPAGVKADLQSDIDDIMALFVDVVAEGRGMSAEAVRATQAAVYRGTRAVEAGLADDIGTFDEALNAFADHLNHSETGGPLVASIGETRRALMKTPKANAPAADKPEPAPETTEAVETTETTETPVAPAAAAPKAPAAAASDDKVALALAGERARIAELTKLAPLASKWGVKFDLNAAIVSGLSVEKAREQIMAQAASDDEGGETIVTSTSHTAREANMSAAIKTGWDRAIERQNKARGIKTP